MSKRIRGLKSKKESRKRGGEERAKAVESEGSISKL